MGRAVNLENGPVGSIVMKLAAPTSINGAVSPIALATARIVPVRIPGIATGRTWLRTVCHLVAPTPKPACRSELGTARRASCELIITTGRVNKPRVRPADSTVLPLAASFPKIAPDVIGSSTLTRMANPSMP